MEIKPQITNLLNCIIYRLIRIFPQFLSIFCFSLPNSCSRDVFYPTMVALGESFWCKQIHQRWNCIFLAISRCLRMLVDSAIFAFRNGRGERTKKFFSATQKIFLQTIDIYVTLSILSSLFFPSMIWHFIFDAYNTKLHSMFIERFHIFVYILIHRRHSRHCHCVRVCECAMRDVVCVCFLYPILTEFQFHQTLPKFLSCSFFAMSKWYVWMLSSVCTLHEPHLPGSKSIHNENS